MPELPEVETLRLQLKAKILNKKIKQVEVNFPGLLNVLVEQFIKAVKGARINGIKRRAKILILGLSSGWSLMVHLKLTGQLICDGEAGTGEPHLVYTFSDGSRLKHYDFRKFGYVKLVKTAEVEKILEKEKLGPEPLEKDFTLAKFQKILQNKPKAKIKPLLMDQRVLAGVGNIYAQETCFFAKISPTRYAGSLTQKEIENLYHGLREILQEAILRHGSSVDAYLDLNGKPGNYVPLLKVYGRGGQKCPRCNAILKQIKLAGRGTIFCPKCQK